MIPPVYSATMNQTGHTLTQRVVALLRARQFLVYYAIVLNAVRSGALLLGTWLATHEPLEKLVLGPREPLASAVAAPGVWTIGLFALSLIATVWLRAGYVRSLAGAFSLRPRDALQFVRLLALLVLVAVASAGANWAYGRAAEGSTTVNLIAAGLGILLGILNVALLYADYVVVLGDRGPAAAIKLSARIAFGALMPSVLVVFVLSMFLQPLLFLPAASLTQGLALTLPMLVVQTLVVGSVLFVADIVLLAVFLDAVEQEAKMSPE